MELQNKKLLSSIEQCREEMVQLAMETSYSNKRVVDISTKLDDLLNSYTNLMKETSG